MANFYSLLVLVSFKGGLLKTLFGFSPIINKDEIESNLLKPQDNVETNINVENESLKCKDLQGPFFHFAKKEKSSQDVLIDGYINFKKIVCKW
jgi:hypothetical protein